MFELLKANKKKVVFTILILCSGIFVSYFIKKIDYEDFSRKTRVDEASYFDFSNYLNANNKNEVFKFPTRQILDSVNFTNINELNKILEAIESTKDRNLKNQLFATLTDSLVIQTNTYFVDYKPDSLLGIIQWAEQYKQYAKTDKTNKSIFMGLYDYWMQYSVNKLNDYNLKSNTLKYAYKFKYLKTRCNEQNYGTNVGFTTTEKVLNNVIDKDWAYLLNRFCIATSVSFKIIFYFFIFLTLYGYYCIFTLYIKNRKSK